MESRRVLALWGKHHEGPIQVQERMNDGRTDEPLGQPVPSNGAVPQLPDTAETLMARGLAEGLAAFAPESDDEPLDDFGQPIAEPSDDEVLADEDADSDESADEAEPDEATQDTRTETKPKRTAAEWAEVIARDGVQRLAEVPRAEIQDVMAAYGEVKAQQAAVSTQTAIAESLRRQDELTGWVRNVDEHFDGDPDGKLAWMESLDPAVAQQVELYKNGKRLLTRIEQQSHEERVSEVGGLNQRAEYQYKRLEGIPEAQAELLRRQQSGRYSGDPAVALDTLARDVDELMRQGYGKGAPAQADGAASDDRAPRKRVARPLVGSGISASGMRRKPSNAPDASTSNDPNELIAMGLADGMRQLR